MFGDKAGVITEDNPAYSLSGPYVRDRGNKVEYDYIQPAPAAQQEIVYEGVL